MGSDTRYGCSPAFRRLPVCGAAPVAGTGAVAAAAREEGKEQEHGMCPGTAGQRSRRPLGGGTSPPAGGQRGRERGQEPARPSPAALAGRGTGPQGTAGTREGARFGLSAAQLLVFPGRFRSRFPGSAARGCRLPGGAGSGRGPAAASLPQRRARWRTRGGSRGAREPLGSGGRVPNPWRGAL